MGGPVYFIADARPAVKLSSHSAWLRLQHRRSHTSGIEIAHEGDVGLSKDCPQPKLFSSMPLSARRTDLATSTGLVSWSSTPSRIKTVRAPRAFQTASLGSFFRHALSIRVFIKSTR